MHVRRHRPALVRMLLAWLCVAPPATAAGLLAQVVDDAGKPVADAVVYATLRGGKPPPRAAPRERLVMDQRNLDFMPYVLPVQAGTPVYFPNSDNLRHHVYSFSPAKKFELPQYKGTPATPVVFDKPGPVALGCNIHDWMIGYVYVLETPYFGKTGDRGETRLANLPAGEVEVRVWHPRLRGAVDKTLRPVALAAGGETRIAFTIGLNPERRRQRPVFSDDAASGYSY